MTRVCGLPSVCWGAAELRGARVLGDLRHTQATVLQPLLLLTQHVTVYFLFS